MLRILGTGVALALVCVLAFPFGRDAYHRYEVAQRLKPLLNEYDQAAWRKLERRRGVVWPLSL
jgi:hypothetical protein